MRRGRRDYGIRIAHAKVANPPTLLTSPTQEELRRAPEAGPEAGPDAGPDAGRGRSGRVGVEIRYARVWFWSKRGDAPRVRGTRLRVDLA